MTLLLAAAGSSHVEAAKYACEFDKDVTALDDTKSTARHLSMGGAQPRATQTEMTEMVQFPSLACRSTNSTAAEEPPVRWVTALRSISLSSASPKSYSAGAVLRSTFRKSS